jgi:hypothetical protein
MHRRASCNVYVTSFTPPHLDVGSLRGSMKTLKHVFVKWRSQSSCIHQDFSCFVRELCNQFVTKVAFVIYRLFVTY